MENEKQGSLEKISPTCQERFLWWLQLSLRSNPIKVGDAQNILVEKKIIKTKEGKLPKEFCTANLNNQVYRGG